MDERLDTKDTLEMIWNRIIENVGRKFRQVRGRSLLIKYPAI